jgi:hypothetical protein
MAGRSVTVVRMWTVVNIYKQFICMVQSYGICVICNIWYIRLGPLSLDMYILVTVFAYVQTPTTSFLPP